MNVHLLYKDSESGPKDVSMNRNELVQDLNLDIIFKTMSRGDKFIYKTARAVMTNPLTDKRTVLYRQGIITDCVKRFDDFNKMYEMTTETIEIVERFKEGAKKSNSSNLSNAANVLYSLELLGILVDSLEKLKLFIDTIESNFNSHGMRSFYDRLISDYSYEFVQKIKNSIEEMNFLTGGGEITFSATVGQGLKTKDIVVNSLVKEEFVRRKGKGVVAQLFYRLFKRNVIMLDASDLDKDARDLEAAGLAHIMKLYQSFIKELTSFFENLHFQISFYIGAANLQIRLKQLHIPTCIPHITNPGMDLFKFRGLYDLSLAIYNRSRPVSNNLETEDLKLFIITGANQGGKSTYLRSIGTAQILMQSGMFVPAEYYCNTLYDGIFSHFTRREDTAMNSGKLDEELARMNRILMSVTPNSLLLMNESFATTTEREGSQIAQNVVEALYENQTKIIMVTHLFEFTKTMFEKKLERTMFLSAERLSDGTRTYRIYESEPERTSYGVDLYDEIVSKH
jgi:DNA mismatch repair ATPase MutS